jgi:dUTP pyrophosphatase
VHVHAMDAAMDLRSAFQGVIEPRGRLLVSTDLRIAIPEGHAGLVLPRSGLALDYGVTVLNAPGCIDPGYTGVVQVLLVNLGERAFGISVGDRIAELTRRPGSIKIMTLPEVAGPPTL